MILNTYANDPLSLQENLKHTFDAICEKNEFGKRAILDHPQGSGEVYCQEFHDGVSMELYDCTFREDITISIQTADANPLYFLYSLLPGVGFSHLPRGLGNFQAAVVRSSKNDPLEIYFPKDIPIQLLIFKIDKELYCKNRNKLIAKKAALQHLFEEQETVSTAHLCSPNICIADLYQKLSLSTLKDPNGIYFLEAEANLIVGHILTQYVTDNNLEETNWILTTSELERVRQMANRICQDPSDAYTIQELSRRTGLNPYKLQEAFKHLYKSTAVKFIQEKRLIKAAELLGTSEYNVTQVVEEIGLSSKSYFSKIFKAKYSCCPKEYQDQFKNRKILSIKV